MPSLIRLVDSLLVLTLVALPHATPQEAAKEPQTSSQVAVAGEWVGVFEIRKQVAFLRVKFEGEPGRLQLSILASQPGAATATQGAELDSSRIRFALTADSAQLFFDGRFDDDRISGMVTRGNDRGTFQLVREPFIDPRQYDDYVGAYELARNRFVIIRRGDRGAQSYLHFVDHSDRTRVLFPVTQDSFFAGPSFLVPLPARIHVGFVRNSQGTVTGLKWRETGRPEAFAPKSNRYTEESVRFQNGSVTLACRLLIPSGARPSPAVLFVQGGPGSGTRNEQYLVVADVFAWHGIAALVCDKRGSGQSNGDWRESGYADMASDVVAGIEFLARRSDIDGQRIGLWATSEGGWVAPIAATQSRRLAFMILVSAPGVSHAALDRALWEAAFPRSGLSEKEIEEAVAFENLYLKFARTGEGWEQFEPALAKARGEKWRYYTTVFTHTWGDLPISRDHWFWRLSRVTADHDPVATLSKVRTPVLAIWGGLDGQMPSSLNRKGVERGLTQGGNPDYTIKIFPRGDHVQWRASTGAWSWIQVERYVPEYFPTMIRWMRERLESPGSAGSRH